MAFLKYAKAGLVRPGVTFQGWDEIRLKGRGPQMEKQAARVVFDQWDPKKYLLSHATIIASVDTENGPGPLGKAMVDGYQIERKYQDYYVTPETSKYINNNYDFWERKLL